MAEVRAVPRATYRLQLRPGFGFAAASEVASYLAELGVSHAYTSPYLQAAPGSTHGYDIVDHHRVNEELGGEAAHRAYVRRLGELGLGQVIDVVPNHMAIGTPGNAWWWDVLENGPASPYAAYFDVDWDPPESKLRNLVLMPVLGDHYGRVLERGEIGVTWEPDARVRVRYHDHQFPLAPRSLDTLLARAARRCDPATADQLAFIGHALGQLPAATATGSEEVLTRHRDKEVLRGHLQRLAAESPEASAAVRHELAELNADVERLDELLDRQNYRLAYWRTGGRELDYRRFFDIDTLVGLRVEAPRVFADTHRLVLSWLAAGEVDGVRIDHPDGLRDPRAYLGLLRAAAPDAWIVVEKILEPGERLPDGWPVEGTTGYDFCHLVTRLLHDPAGESPILEGYHDFVGDPTPYDEVVHAAKHRVLHDVLTADLDRLAHLFVQVVESHRRWRDFTRRDLRAALAETAACFSVYRTYLTARDRLSPGDQRHLAAALAEAAERRGDLDGEVFELLGLVLRGDLEPGPGPAVELALGFQQLTAPVMAKSVEDTVFYDHVPLVSLNEVGADPAQFAIDLGEFHRSMVSSAERAPYSMLALSTHDTKRSEDVRARLALLSEIPEAWNRSLRRWSELAAPHRRAHAPHWPGPRMESLLFQTLVGAHPLSSDRAAAYLAKAAKEAKRHTSWVDADPAYDEALEQFVAAVCADPDLGREVADFAESLQRPGWVNSLAQKLIQLTAPGVPDVYQGTELWDLSLVDPDNRRPVDFDRRRHLLDAAAQMTPGQLWQQAPSGLPKLWVVQRASTLRRARSEWFLGATYEPLPARGHAADHVVAFARGGHAVTVAPRLPVGLERGGGWGGTTITLPPGTWHDHLTGRRIVDRTVPVAELLAELPVALLHDDADLAADGAPPARLGAAPAAPAHGGGRR